MRVFLALTLVTVLLGGCRSPEERLAEHRRLAEAYLEEEEWEKAKIELWNVIQLDPDDADAHFEMAGTLWQLREFPEARWQFMETVRLAPGNLEARMKLAEIEVLARRVDAALEQLSEVLAQDSEHVQAILLRAVLLQQNAEGGFDVDRFLAEIETALAIEPSNTQTLLLKARALETKGDLEAAEATYRHLIEVAASTPSYTALGLFLAGRERSDESMGAFRKAIEVAEGEQEKIRARTTLAGFLARAEDAEGAEAALLANSEEFPESSEALISLARFYVAQGDRARAEEVFTKYAELDPEDPQRAMMLASFLKQSGDSDRSLEVLNRALEANPDFALARVQRAELMLEASGGDPGEIARVEAEIEAVLEASPGLSEARFAKAKILIFRKQFEAGAQQLREVIEEHPGNSNAHMLLGSALLGDQQVALASSEFLRAVQLDRNNYEARTQLAGTYLRLGERELALDEAGTALQGRPGNPRLLLIQAAAAARLGRNEMASAALDQVDYSKEERVTAILLPAVQIYLRLGNVGQARVVLEQARSVEPENPLVLTQLVASDLAEQKPEQALERLNAAIEAAPDEAQYYALRGRLRLFELRGSDGEIESPEQAEQDLTAAIEKDPSGSDAYRALAAYYETSGRAEDATATYEKARANQPENASVRLVLGSLYETSGRKADAIAEYEAAVRLDPSQAVARNNLAWLLAESAADDSSELDRALELAQDARELLPEDPSVADTLGWVLYRKNIPIAAIPLFREALGQLGPESAVRPMIRFHLAQAYDLNGELEKAITEIEETLVESTTFPSRPEAEAFLKQLKES